MANNTSAQIAKHLREVYFGGNWTCSNVQDQLTGLSWQEVTRQVFGLNSIATLANHIGYYIGIQIKVLEGGPLEGKDEYSFQYPPITSQEDWDQMRARILAEAETLAGLIETMPEADLWADFTDEKYGNYFRNLLGLIEHTHYHLGQIALVKKVLAQVPIA